MLHVAPEFKIQLFSCELSPVFFVNFHIGRLTYNRRVYLLWLSFICTIFWLLIHFIWYVCTSFKIFRVPVNFLIWCVRFRKICNEMILWSTSEAHIWFLTVAFITLTIILVWIKSWFLIALYLLLLLKSFTNWEWTSTVTAPWLKDQ